MRFAYTLTLSLAIAAPLFAGQPNWVLGSQSKDGNWYIDLNSISANGNDRTAWVQSPGIPEDKIAYSRMQMRFYCSSKSIEILFAVAYSGDDTVTHMQQGNGTPTPAVPGSVFNTLIDTVCTRK